MHASTRDQQVIIEGLKAMQPEVISRLVGDYSGRLFTVIHHYTNNSHDAEEVLQDTFLRIIAKIDTFRDEGDLWAWMKRIAVNNGLMWLRRHRSRLEKTTGLDDVLPKFTQTGDSSAPVTEWNSDPEQVYSNAELAKKLYDVIRALPHEYRVPLILKDIEGYSSREIAAALGLKQPTANTRIHRARLAVREELAHYFSYL